MKHQKTSGILRGAWLLLLLVMVSGVLHAWQVDVFVNGSSEGPTMSFGEGTATMAPMPPFSGMYGVVDVYFANPQGVYPTGTSLDIQEYYNRLSVDIKASATRADNRWVLVAGSNARLTWTAVDGAIPANFTIAWTEKGEGKSEPVVAGATFSVKAGITYTLGVGVGTADVQTDPNNPNQMVGKDDQGNLEPAIITLNIPSITSALSYTISINLNAGTTLLAFPFYEAGVLTKYKANNGTEILPADLAAAAAWIVEVVAPGYAVVLAWDGTDPNVLIATLTKDSTRADGDWLLSAQPTKTGLAPLDANASLTNADGTALNELLGNLIAIIQQLGTLDFDGNQVVNMDDVMYLYNYASWGFPSADEGQGWFDGSYLLPYTENATGADADAALVFLQANFSEVDYDGSAQIDMDDVMYLYNYASWGFPSAAEGQGWFDGSYLLPYTESANTSTAATALSTMQEFVE